MVIVFQIILLLIIFESFANFARLIGDEKMQEKTLTILLASIAAFIVSVLWL